MDCLHRAFPIAQIVRATWAPVQGTAEHPSPVSANASHLNCNPIWIPACAGMSGDNL